jgi:hypothetical protein
MMHVFSTHESSDTASPVGRTLLNEEVYDTLLRGFSPKHRTKMKLVLNHFTSNTISTFSPVKASDDAWREALPSLVTDHNFVLNGILAIGCLHLSTLTSLASEREECQSIAATQMNIGVTQYQIKVEKITTNNAEALFAFSAMITMFVLSTASAECRTALKSLADVNKSEEHRQEIISYLISSICRIFRTMRGVLVILVPYYYHIRNGKLEPVLDRGWWPTMIPGTIEEIEQDQKLRNLEKMWSRPNITYEYCFDALRNALKTLREASALVSQLATSAYLGNSLEDHKFDWTSILHWPVGLPFDFLVLLEQRRMEAWVLMAHYALQPAKATSNLWLNGFATNLVTASALVICEENWEWIAWPAAVVGVDLDSLRNTQATS